MTNKLIAHKLKKLPLLLFVFLLISCGTSKETIQKDAVQDEFAYSYVANKEKKFNVDQFVVAGWKKSKFFVTDALDKDGNMITPDAIEIWYGFYNKKDIEIRFYEDHDVALRSGVQSAENAVGRAVNANSKGGIITSTNNRVSYQSYVVAGNTVILCQDLLNNCKELSDKLKQE